MVSGSGAIKNASVLLLLALVLAVKVLRLSLIAWILNAAKMTCKNIRWCCYVFGFTPQKFEMCYLFYCLEKRFKLFHISFIRKIALFVFIFTAPRYKCSGQMARNFFRQLIWSHILNFWGVAWLDLSVSHIGLASIFS